MGQPFEPQGFSSFYNAGVQLRKLMFSHQRSVPATDQVELLFGPLLFTHPALQSAMASRLTICTLSEHNVTIIL